MLPFSILPRTSSPLPERVVCVTGSNLLTENSVARQDPSTVIGILGATVKATASSVGWQNLPESKRAMHSIADENDPKRAEGPAPQKAPGRVAAVDFGLARLGLAISDPERILASPAGTLPRRSAQQEAEFFRRFTREHDITLWVVGLPLHLSGEESPLSLSARQFGSWLEKVTGVPVVFYDERFSTREAESALASAGLRASQRRRKRDTVAAQRILTAYLESHRSSER